LIRFLDKYFPILTPLSLIIGLLIGASIGQFVSIVPVLFAGMTFIGSLKIDFNTFLQTVKQPKGILLTMLILRVLMPIIAVMFGRILFPQNIYTQTGLLLFGLLPVGVNSVLWTVITKGNVALTLSVVLLDTMLSPFLLPLSVLLLTGTSIEIDPFGIASSLFLMVVLPSIAGMTLNQVTKGDFGQKYSVKLAPLAKLLLISVIMINGGNVRYYFPPLSLSLVAIIMSIGTLAIIGYLISWWLAKAFKLPEQDIKAVVFAGGMRNMSTGVVIAVVHFTSGGNPHCYWNSISTSNLCNDCESTRTAL